MRHLFNSYVRVEMMDTVRGDDGRVRSDWVPVTTGNERMDKRLAYLNCRLDLSWLRPGKDVPQAQNAGKAPDRFGVMFLDGDVPLRAGYRIVTVPNPDGTMPVTGTFEIKTIPDEIIGYYALHHKEVQIVETLGPSHIPARWPKDGE